MFSFVLGFLSELARETGDWLDRILPAPRLRRSLRGWRRRRPFWAAVWVIAGGVEMVAIPLAPLPLMIKVGVGAMSAVGISLVLIAGGVFFLFKPDQRMFVSVVTTIASLTSLATTNLGGFGMGMLAGLIGSSMAFGWLPHRVPEDHDEGGGRDPHTDRPGSGSSEIPVAAASATSSPSSEPEAPGPKAREVRARYGERRSSVRRAVLFTVTAVVAAGLPAVGTAAAAPRTDSFPIPSWPWPWPWDPAPTPAPSPSPSSDATGTPTQEPTSDSSVPPSPSPSLSDDSDPDSDGAADGDAAAPDADTEGSQVTLPCLTGIDTGGLPNPQATPGETSDDPDDLTALRPPIVVGDQPGRPRSTYPVSPAYPEVGADTLTAYGAIVHGATYLPTVSGGRMKVLWVHADRLVADDYAFRLETGDQVQTIDVDLDIPQVDIYVTRLIGSLTIPVLDVGTPRICIGADIVPANLPIAVQLPKLEVTTVEAGQVLVDAETVNFADLTVRSRHR
ncbi:DUF6114 domain-containing protein [Streptomyces sp. CWNU-52B]|uniref:DUF6114 domain-containing protein n=1 Tax=unclassified Streptomyces TaxID=2593676 RepID=UPI0039BF7255